MSIDWTKTQVLPILRKHQTDLSINSILSKSEQLTAGTLTITTNAKISQQSLDIVFKAVRACFIVPLLTNSLQPHVIISTKVLLFCLDLCCYQAHRHPRLLPKKAHQTNYNRVTVHPFDIQTCCIASLLPLLPLLLWLLLLGVGWCDLASSHDLISSPHS